MNRLFKVNGNGFTTCPEENSDKFKNLLTEYCAEMKEFKVGHVPMDELPTEIINECKKVLKAFNEVTVIYQNGGFNVSTGVSLRASYPFDHFVCGTYYQEKVYTSEERRENFFESFGYYPRYSNSRNAERIHKG